MSKKNLTPLDKPEAKERIAYYVNAMNGHVTTHECLCTWYDLCGIGSLLERVDWDLDQALKQGLFRILAAFHSIATPPFFVASVGVVNEASLMINDGVARAIDTENLGCVDEYWTIQYLNHLLQIHFQSVGVAKQYGLSSRAVMATGVRADYAPSTLTGESILYHHEDAISDYGKKLLNKTFVYNPSELQMNTAFAKAYTIEDCGKKSCILVGNFYMEESAIELFRKHASNTLQNSILTFQVRNKDALIVQFGDPVIMTEKGIKTTVFPVLSFKVCLGLESDEVFFDMMDIDLERDIRMHSERGGA